MPLTISPEYLSRFMLAVIFIKKWKNLDKWLKGWFECCFSDDDKSPPRKLRLISSASASVTCSCRLSSSAPTFVFCGWTRCQGESGGHNGEAGEGTTAPKGEHTGYFTCCSPAEHTGSFIHCSPVVASVINEAYKKGRKPEVSDLHNRADDAFLNDLESGVDGWKPEIQKVCYSLNYVCAVHLWTI